METGQVTRESLRYPFQNARAAMGGERNAGLGVPSEAAEAMEMGADACLIKTAIARAQDPARMGRAMAMGLEAGRHAFLAGRMPVLPFASASSPLEGVVR